jgi:hypothetical protein
MGHIGGCLWIRNARQQRSHCALCFEQIAAHAVAPFRHEPNPFR